MSFVRSGVGFQQQTTFISKLLNNALYLASGDFLATINGDLVCPDSRCWKQQGKSKGQEKLLLHDVLSR